MDKLREKSDKELARIEKELRKIYKQSEDEIQEKWDGYMERAAERTRKLEEALQKAKEGGNPEEIEEAKAKLESALKSVTVRDESYKHMLDQTTERMAKVNETALAYVNGQIPNIYTMNYNETLLEIQGEIPTKMGIVFDLVDEQTVKNLVMDKKLLLPQKTINVPKDKRWNAKAINSQVIQGILQGEGIPKISKRLQGITDMNRSAAIRNARTMTTAAENNGRMSGLKAAEEQGIVYEKQWMSTHDELTRESHAELDGVSVGIDEEFPNGLQFPGDPSGDPGEVYNCRCSMVRNLVGFRREDGSISEVEDIEKYEPDYFEKQQEEKAEEEKAEEAVFESQKMQDALGKRYEEFQGMVQGSGNAAVWNKYSEGATYSKDRKGGYYDPRDNSVHYSYDKGKHEGINEYSTLAHECGHMMDDGMGRRSYLSYNEIDTINSSCRANTSLPDILKAKPSNSDEFLTALRKDMEEIKPGIDDGSLIAEIRKDVVTWNSTNGVQDAMDGFFSTQRDYYTWGHGERYYNQEYNSLIKMLGKESNLKDAYISLGMDVKNQKQAKTTFRHYEAASEAWANVNAAATVGGEELEAMEKYMPNTLKAYKEIMEKEANA